MPTYDYRCRDCGHTIEVIHAMSEEGPAACDVCGGPVRRVLFPAGIIFKGSGFYRNDSRKEAASGSSSRPATSKSSDASAAGPSEAAAGSSDAPSGSTSTKSEPSADTGSGGAKPAPPPPSPSKG